MDRFDDSVKLRIGVVCYPTFGGSGVLATELGMQLARDGHQVHFIASEMPVKLDTELPGLFFHKVTFNSYPLFQYDPYEIALTSKIVAVAKAFDLQLLHVHYALPHASAAYFAKQILEKEGLRLPFVTTLHGTDITVVGKDAAFAPVIAYSINHSDIVTSVSESLKADTLSTFDIDREIVVIPNFVCNAKYENRNAMPCHRDVYAPTGESIIMHISNFRKVKRIDDILKSFQLVRAKVPCKLLLIGDGPERIKMEELSVELGVQDSVIFIGEIKDTEVALCAADVFVLASEKESFGLAVLEAMAASVPVVSTDSGGIPEVNIHGESGFLSSVGDIVSMADHIIELISNEGLRQQMAQKAKERAL